MDINLITTEDIKSVTTIPKSLLTEKIDPLIFLSENFYVYPILGTALVTELKQELTGNSLTALNTVLIASYIKPVVAYATIAEFIANNYEITNKGVQKLIDDNANTPSLEELEFFKNNVEPKIPFFQDRLKAYLNNNKTSYPLYREDCVPKKNPTGIFLGKYY